MHFDAIYMSENKYFLPDEHVWTPEHGLIALAEFIQNKVGTMQISQISEAHECDENDDIPPTVPFHAMLKGRVVSKNYTMSCWITADVQPHDLSNQFHDQMVFRSCMNDELGVAFELAHEISMKDVAESQTFVTTCHKDDTVLFLSLDRKRNVRAQLKDMQLSELQFDQFGILGVGQKLTSMTMLSDFRLLHQSMTHHACVVLAAYQQVQMSYLWNAETMQVIMTMQGPVEARQIMTEFWYKVLDDHTVDKLQIRSEVVLHPGITKLMQTFALPIPPDSYALALAVLATRKFCTDVEVPGQVRVIVQWLSKAVWDGPLPKDFNMTTLAAILQLTFFPWCKGRSMRIVHKAKQCCDVTVEQLSHETDSAFLLLKLVQETSGGAGTKETQKAYVKNSLAATMLEQGYPIDWVSVATDTLMNQVGIKRATQVTQLPPGKQRLDALMQLCSDCQLEPPQKVMKNAAATAKLAAHQNRKRVAVQINPAEYQIEAGFFLSQTDQSLPQIPEIRAKSTGVVLLTLDKAKQWVSEGQTISSDELAMIVVGEHQLQCGLPHEIVHVPCKDMSHRPVIMKATLVQLGEKRVKTQADKHPAIVEDETCTISITMWKSDWKTEDWAFLVDHPFAFARQVLKNQGQPDILQSTWGKSLRHMKNPTTAQHATSVQFHATVKSEHMRDLLALSGFNYLWIVPKTEKGRLDLKWRILWIEGNFAHLNTVASQTQGCAGLVKSKTSFGLRYAEKDFEAAWNLVNPGKPVPQAMDTQNLFQVQCLPYGCSADMLHKWSQLIQWEFRAIRAVGPTSWLIGSKSIPPEGIHTFNSRPVLIKYLPPRDSLQNNPILAGPMPSKKEVAVAAGDASSAFFDPWAAAAQLKTANASASANNTANVPGPTEARFQEHANKLNEQETKLQQIEHALTKLQEDTRHEFQQVQVREQQAQAQVQQAIMTVKNELDNSFQKAIQQQSVQLNNTLGELRSLLQAPPKRSRSPTEEEMKD